MDASWSADPPSTPGWYQWVWPRGRLEVNVRVIDRDGILWADFVVPMPLESVATWYPGCRWKPARPSAPIVPRNFD